MNVSSSPLHLLRLALAGLLLASLSTAALARDYDRDEDRLVNLRGSWRFSVGDDARWAQPDFNDRAWSRIHVPSYWEEEGYRDYNGYAWYRRDFTFDGDPAEPVHLLLGRIDDADEVFVNGRLVGASGRFPPDYLTAYNHDRVYTIPAGVLVEGGRNLIAVRVYDGASGGGITGRSIGLYRSTLILPDIDLTGEWKFQRGDNPAWKEPQADESEFVSIPVPSAWEHVGHDFDGFAWYRKTFRAPASGREDKMVLMLGKIDDADEVFLNGTKIGSTGTLTHSDRHGSADLYDQNRGYYFPSSLLKDENVIAVRVHDHGGLGGIYEGPIGIIRQSRYIEYWEATRHDRRHSGRWGLRLVFGDD